MHTLPFTLRLASAKDLYILQAYDGEQWSTPVTCLEPQYVNELIDQAQQILDVGHSPTDAERLGKRLFDLVFQGSVGVLYYQMWGRAAHDSAALSIRVAIDSGVQELHALPWELLHDGQQFLSLNATTHISRFHDTNSLGRSLPVEEPVRILLTSSTPADAPPLDPTLEEKAIRSALEPFGSRVELVVLRNIAFRTLRHQLKRQESKGQPFHIWHHLGHSRITKDANGRSTFGLTFDDGGHSYDEPISSIAVLVRSCVSMRGVIFATCHGAEVNGIAPVLANLGLPLVVGFRGTVTQEITRVFTQEFYATLAESDVDKAATGARQFIATEFPQSLAWATPLVFLASQERQLWTKQSLPPSERPEHSSHNTVSTPSTGLKIGKLQTNDFEYIGTVTIGSPSNIPPPPELTTIEIDDIEAKSTRMINALTASGVQLTHLSELREIIRNFGGNE